MTLEGTLTESERLTNPLLIPESMLPWGPTALAYVLYSGFRKRRYDSQPTNDF